MNRLRKNKKNNVLTASAGVTTAILFVATITAATANTISHFAYAWINPDVDPVRQQQKAPTVISGGNIYVVWSTDRGTANANGEVMFRASTDGGTTFDDKINISNTTGADSLDAQISAEAGNVVVTWWERNQTNNSPVMRMSNDNGETFGPVLNLAANGTIGIVDVEVAE
jgi:hypothetical protein